MVLVCRNVVPARTFSRPGAIIFRPHAATAFSQASHLSPASRISAIPFGLNIPFMWVEKGPSLPTSVILSPTFNSPLFRITSTVFPNPLSSFISRTVASPLPNVSRNLSSKNLSASPTVTVNRSCKPSPSLAEQGTKAKLDLKSLILSYLSILNPCSLNCPSNFQYFSSKNCLTSSLCSDHESINDRPSFVIHPCILSTLFAATTNGVFLSLRILKLSIVCGCNPSITSTTSIAMSASAPPLLRRLVNEWCPGVSMNKRPGLLKSFPPVILEHVSLRIFAGISVAPMCCVIPPASRSITLA